jgi:hypothetical protein
MQARLAHLERDVQTAERATEELQTRLREDQMELRAQREVLQSLVNVREAEKAAEVQVTPRLRY